MARRRGKTTENIIPREIELNITPMNPFTSMINNREVTEQMMAPSLNQNSFLEGNPGKKDKINLNTVIESQKIEP